MAISDEIARLQQAKADLKTAIENKGVTVPSSTKLDGYADLVDSIETGGGDNTGEWTYIKCNTSVNGTNPNAKAGSKFYIQYTNSSNLIVEFISTVNYTTRTWGSNKLVSTEPTLLEDYDTWYRIKPNNMNVGDIGTLTITQSAGTVIYTFKLIKTFSETAELDVMATDYDADIEKLNVSGGSDDDNWYGICTVDQQPVSYWFVKKTSETWEMPNPYSTQINMAKGLYFLYKGEKYYATSVTYSYSS